MRYPVLGATFQPRAGIAKHDYVAWGFARAADALGVDLIQHCEVTGIMVAGGRVTGVRTTRGDIAAESVALSAAGHSSVLAAMVGLPLPIQSHPLQALVSELLEPVHPTVVMSNAVHVYVSQAHKGELVMGAGIDAYNSYSQRGALHVIERQMAAAVELFPIFARAHVLRTWGGIVDVSPDASPIVGLTPIEGLFLNCGWGTGGFKATPGVGWCFAHTIAHGRAAPAERRRSPWTASPPARSSTSTAPPPWRTEGPGMLLITCPWCGPRDETEFHYGGQAGRGLPGRTGRAQRRGVGPVPVLPGQPEGPVRRALVRTRPAAAAGSTSSGTP